MPQTNARVSMCARGRETQAARQLQEPASPPTIANNLSFVPSTRLRYGKNAYLSSFSFSFLFHNWGHAAIILFPLAESRRTLDASSKGSKRALKCRKNAGW